MYTLQKPADAQQQQRKSSRLLLEINPLLVQVKIYTIQDSNPIFKCNHQIVILTKW